MYEIQHQELKQKSQD